MDAVWKLTSRFLRYPQVAISCEHPVFGDRNYSMIDLADEPLIHVDDVQGNVLGGFKHQHRWLFYCCIDDGNKVRENLREITPHLTTADQTLDASTGQSQAVVNIAFSFSGLQRLVSDADRFTDAAFRAGLAGRSRLLGDPESPSLPGNPANWVVGGQGREADMIIILASEQVSDINALASELIPRRCSVIHIDRGETMPAGSHSREHFGFVDSISQPGVRGRPAGSPEQPLEDRGKYRSFAHVGNWDDLVWPGEFIFGYPTQGLRDPTVAGRDRLAKEAPPWARNGSYLVVRRLRQNVFLFHQFVRRSAARLGISADTVAARMVGRWPNGTSLLAGIADDESLFDLERPSVHDFAFDKDPDGLACPISAHIRKVHPRLITSPTGNMLPNPEDTSRHRILRRGLPYGPPSLSTITRPIDDLVDRGLLFMSYQTSIEEQFEFIVRRWANEPNFPEQLSGFDPIIGQNHKHPNRRRSFQIWHGWQGRVTTESEWVISTGGGYFFSPGREGFEHIARR